MIDTEKGKEKRKVVHLPAEDYEKLNRIAKRYGIKKAWLIMALLKDYDEKKKKAFENGWKFGEDYW